MKKYRHLIKQLRSQKGVSAILVALLLIVLIGMAALAIDIGYALVTRNELQNVSDASSLAATGQLGAIYKTMSYAEQQTYVCDPSTIRPAAKDVAAQNKAAGANVTINDEDIIIGRWDGKTKTLTETLNQPDAVRVISRRDGSANGPISTFFARVFGIGTVNVLARGTSALTGESTTDPGDTIPVGIDEQWFLNKEEFCNQPIKFYPTNTPEGCAGWHTYDRWPASESYLRKTILEGWLEGTFTSPASEVNEQFVFTGGTLGEQTFTAFQNLFEYMKTRDGDGNDSAWTAKVVVYEASNCTNPNGYKNIVGFATTKITAVEPPPAQTIQAQVICENVEPGRGGGGSYGTKGSIPGLVE